MFRFVSYVFAATFLTVSGFAQAVPIGGLVDTDRFGYTGTITRHDSQTDAESGTNVTETINVGDRDLALFIAQNDTEVSSDYNIIMSSWWYTTDDQGRAGWGNTRGNTGVGFLQLYDSDGSTDTDVSMEFSGFDGTYYTQFDLGLTGSDAGSDDYARLSAYDNVNDGGIWHDYALNLTATGLEGTTTAPGIIESTNQPTDVSGSITGVFEITENQTSPANQGFYAVDLSLSMTNWAWNNRDDLMTQDENGNPISDTFASSTFRTVSTVPEPGTIGLMAIAGLGMVAARRRRRYAVS